MQACTRSGTGRFAGRVTVKRRRIQDPVNDTADLDANDADELEDEVVEEEQKEDEEVMRRVHEIIETGGMTQEEEEPEFDCDEEY